MSKKASTPDCLTVLACQLDVPPDMQSEAERSHHLVRTAALLDSALSQKPAGLVVLPELSSVSYTRHCFANPAVFAEESNGISFEQLAPVARAHATCILYGAPRAHIDGSLRITQFLIGPDGQALGHFDKLHLAQYGASMEKDYFAEGSELLVFEINGVKCAPLICYDMRFPGLAAELVHSHNVQVLLHVAAFYRDESFDSWHSFAKTRAMENQVYWLSLNRAGEQFGESIFCDPWVDEKSPAITFGFDEQLCWFDIKPERIEQIRHNYSFTSDRLEDYSTLSPRVVVLS